MSAELDPAQYRISPHAAARIVDMALDPTEVVACLGRPDRISHPRNYPSRQNYTRGRITLVTATDPDGTLAVVTALWATEEAWRSDYKYPAAPGRAPRQRLFTKEGR